MAHDRDERLSQLGEVRATFITVVVYGNPRQVVEHGLRVVEKCMAALPDGSRLAGLPEQLKEELLSRLGADFTLVSKRNDESTPLPNWLRRAQPVWYQFRRRVSH